VFLTEEQKNPFEEGRAWKEGAARNRLPSKSHIGVKRMGIGRSGRRIAGRDKKRAYAGSALLEGVRFKNRVKKGSVIRKKLTTWEEFS